VAWSEICVLARLNLLLAFDPQSSLDTQLFLPDLFHIITLLLGAGPVPMRQTVYGLLVNILQSLVSTSHIGDMDRSAMERLFGQVQTREMVTAFGLVHSPDSLEFSGGFQRTEADVGSLADVEQVAKFLGEVLIAGAVAMGKSLMTGTPLTADCANAWRARWMSLVAATCFQHNPATQPQAFTVLGHLASDEVDDDLVYQILVAMSSTLSHFTESDQILVISMLRCLSRIVPGLLPGSRYAACLFCLAVGFLQLSYIPLFAASLELMLVALRAIDASAPQEYSLVELLLNARQRVGDPALKLDQVCGVSFDTDPCFSLVAVVFKGVRHPSTGKLAMEVLMELLQLSSARAFIDDVTPGIAPSGVPFFVALLPAIAGAPADLKALFAAGGMDVADGSVQDLSTLPVFEVLSIP